MTFSQKSDVKKHLARPVKKPHYLTPEVQGNLEEKGDLSPAGPNVAATLLDDREPVLVVKGR
jgi:hypothetical protein